jgi:uncharacterized protein YyaL (SSP411 family)
MQHEHPANRLAGETSPYLIQHAHNPVDWFPWGPEALQKAREEEKPIFLSIGYSACHWCHVMERESFEDERIAALLKANFVSIKVDREERPDLDDIYMKAVQALTGQGGWPMTVFLTPELEPFYGGTYFPPFSKFGRPGFADVLMQLGEAWRTRRDTVVKQAARLTEQIAREGRQDTGGSIAEDVLDRSLSALESSYDPVWGGFGSAPKFPHPTDLRLMLRHAVRTGRENPWRIVTHTLDRMADGGIYDQLGGGFHRYSTDEEWLVPHFEKMLYDNALLVPVYIEAFLATGAEKYARIARGACDWVLREMITPQGAIASTQDADSEGEEGLFFVWTAKELRAVLGKDLAERAEHWWAVADGTNFEGGTNILWRKRPAAELAARFKITPEQLEADMERARELLFAARSKRIAPATDDKVLTAWNGLMISAFALAAQALGEDAYLEAAQRAANYLLTDMRQANGRLHATSRAGRAKGEACLDDYAFLIQGLLDLYETDFDERWLREALAFEEVLTDGFEDDERGGYFTTGRDHEQLIARLKSPQDGALPSGNGVQACNLLRLALLCGSGSHAQTAERHLLSFGELLNRYPQAFSSLLLAVDFLQVGPREWVIAGAADDPEADEMLTSLRKRFLPQRVVVRARPSTDRKLIPLAAGRGETGPAQLFLCRNHACQLPATSIESARELIARESAVRATD